MIPELGHLQQARNNPAEADTTTIAGFLCVRSRQPFHSKKKRLDAAVTPSRWSAFTSQARTRRTADVISAIIIPVRTRGHGRLRRRVGRYDEGHIRTPAQLRLIDRIYTGQMSTVTVVPGTCQRSPPARRGGTDAVVMVEETASREQIHSVAASAGRNIGRRGADIMTGDPVVRAGNC